MDAWGSRDMPMDGESSLSVLFVVRLVSATTFSATSRARLRYASAGAQSRGGAGGRELAGAECVNRDGSTTRPVASAGKAGGKVRAGAAVPASRGRWWPAVTQHPAPRHAQPAAARRYAQRAVSRRARPVDERQDLQLGYTQLGQRPGRRVPAS